MFMYEIQKIIYLVCFISYIRLSDYLKTVLLRKTHVKRVLSTNKCLSLSL